MNRTVILFAAMGLIIGSVVGQGTNPFFEKWTTPFEVPPFEQIKNEHYMPAFLEGMKQQQAEIAAIVNNTDAPTFENTIVLLDNSGELLDKVSSVFYALNGANTNKEMQDIARQLSPVMSKHSDDISLNPGLFKKIKELYESRDRMKLDADQRKLLEEKYKGFVRGGANLEPAQQEKLRELNKQISMLQLNFGQNLLAETNSFKLVIDDQKELSGLPPGAIAAASEAADENPETRGKWVFSLQNPSIMPFLQFADSRMLREKDLQRLYQPLQQ